MSPKQKFFLLLFAFLLIIFSLLIAQISIAAETQLQLQVPFGGLPSSLTISGEAFATYVSAIYIFGAATIVALCIVMIMVGGLQWLLAGGDSGKIGKAKDTVIKALTGLLIALFAVYILNIVNPRTTTLMPLTPQISTQGICCFLAGPPEQYKLTQSKEECEKEAGWLSLGSLMPSNANYQKCLDNILKPPELDVTSPPPDLSPSKPGPTDCSSYNYNKAQCDAHSDTCMWKDPLCLSKLADDPLKSRCPDMGASKSDCQAVSGNGCVWESKQICAIKRGEKVESTDDPCTKKPPVLNPTACKNIDFGGKKVCQWYTTGVCISKDTGNIAYTGKCATITESEKCVENFCAWISGKCQELSTTASTCGSHAECGSTSYCGLDDSFYKAPASGGIIDAAKVKAISNTGAAGMSGVCRTKLKQGDACWGRVIPTTILVGYFLDDDAACQYDCGMSDSATDCGLCIASYPFYWTGGESCQKCYFCLSNYQKYPDKYTGKLGEICNASNQCFGYDNKYPGRGLFCACPPYNGSADPGKVNDNKCDEGTCWEKMTSGWFCDEWTVKGDLSDKYACKSYNCQDVNFASPNYHKCE